MELSIIIINYNVKYFLEQCLHSVVKACDHIDSEIIVVDNHSSDNSEEYLHPKFKTVQFIWNDKNVGFGRANNLALQKATGNFVLFLNPDTIVPEDGFSKCIQFFRDNISCGALGVKMIDGAGFFLKESKRSFPGPLTSFFKLSGLSALFPGSPRFSRYYAGHLNEKSTGEVDVLAGAYFMIRRQALALVNGFDEDFFMYGEDIDLSYRIQKAGFKNYYYPETAIIHFKGESTSKMSAIYSSRFYGAMELFVRKHYGNNSFSTWLMIGAIRISSLASVISRRLRKTSAVPVSRRKIENFIIIADEASFDQIRRALIEQKSIGNTSQCIHSGLADCEQHLSRNGTTNIVFSESICSFKDIISTTALLKGRCAFYYHARNSNCLVGSSDKNKNGEFIPF